MELLQGCGGLERRRAFPAAALLLLLLSAGSLSTGECRRKGSSGGGGGSSRRRIGPPARTGDGGYEGSPFVYRTMTCCRAVTVALPEFGGVGDGVTSNTRAFQSAVAHLAQVAPCSSGGGQLYVPPGRWLTGSFNLTSCFTLYLHRDAVILGSQDMNEWPIIDPLPSYGRGRDAPGGRYSSLILGSNLTDVAITGDNGTIDGQGAAWWSKFRSHNLRYTRAIARRSGPPALSGCEAPLAGVVLCRRRRRRRGALCRRPSERRPLYWHRLTSGRHSEPSIRPPRAPPALPEQPLLRYSPEPAEKPGTGD